MALHAGTYSKELRDAEEGRIFGANRQYFAGKLLAGIEASIHNVKDDLSSMTSIHKEFVSVVKASHGELSVIIKKVVAFNAAAVKGAEAAQVAAKESAAAMTEAKACVAKAEVSNTTALARAREAEIAANESRQLLDLVVEQFVKIEGSYAKAEADVGIVYEQRGN